MKKAVKQIEVTRRKAYTPSEIEKNQILENIYVDSLGGFGFYEAVVADTRLDRHNDVLSKSFLDAMAEKYNEGRTVVHGHKELIPCGRTFSAEVKQVANEPEHYELNVKFYIPQSSLLASGMSAKEAIDTGLISRVSVSFMAKEAYKYIEKEESGFWFWEKKDYSDTNTFDVFELSLVTMGAQAMAVIKELEKDPKPKDTTLHQNSKDKTNQMKYFIKSLNTEVEANEDTKAAIELLEEKAVELDKANALLQAFQQKEEAAKLEIVKELVGLKMKALKDLDADKETEKYKKFSIEELNGEIEGMKRLQKSHKAITPSPQAQNATVDDLPSWFQ